MKKIAIIAILLACSTMAAKAWVHGLAAAGIPTCTLGQTGVTDLTNTCNNIYVLTGMF
jgi:hypothetical protein